MSEQPTFRTLTFHVMEQEPEAEVISIISQVMNLYIPEHHLTHDDRFAIAEWFLEQYGKGRKQP